MTGVLDRPAEQWADPPWDEWLLDDRSPDDPPPVFGPPWDHGPQRPRPPKKVAIVGIGRETKWYLDACDDHRKVQLVGLVGPASERLSELAANGRVWVFKDLDELAESEVGVDLLVIIEQNPEVTFALMQQAREHGWAVLCRWPFTEVADEARRQFADAHRTGWPLMVAAPEQFADAPALAVVESAAFGAVAEVTATWDCSDGPDGQRISPHRKVFGRLLMGLLHVAMPFFGGEAPLLVAADWPDQVLWAELTFGGGRQLTAKYTISKERTDDALLVVVKGDGTELELRGDEMRWRSGIGEWMPLDQPVRKAEVARLVVGAALDRLDGGVSWDDDIVRDVAILEALHLSHALGGEPVPLP